MGQEFRFDDDQIWSEAARIAEAAVAKGQEQIRARCREIGIPDRFAPSISLGWRHRGYDNTLKERRDELRKMAVTAIEAQQAKAITSIELSCLDAQTKLAVSGLTSEAALGFVEALPSVEDLMPGLSFAEVAGESQPPVAERLLSSNALRQQRFRERRAAALHSVTEPLHVTGRNGGEGDVT